MIWLIFRARHNRRFREYLSPEPLRPILQAKASNHRGTADACLWAWCEIVTVPRLRSTVAVAVVRLGLARDGLVLAAATAHERRRLVLLVEATAGARRSAVRCIRE
jgi:hypothetical protein